MIIKIIQNTLLLSLFMSSVFSFSAQAADVPTPIKLKTIAILTPEQSKDFGWNQQGVLAAKAVAEKLNLKIIVAQGIGYGNIRPTLRELISDGADLIIAHAGGYNASAVEIGFKTDTPVAIVDQPALAEPQLVADYTSSGYKTAFLAGYLASKMTRSNIIGIVTSGEPPAWNSQSHAFAQGAQKGNPKIKVHYAVIGPAAYSDVTNARRVTKAVIATGADIILGQGNGSSFGMLQAIETTKAVDGGKVWFIDVIGDKSLLDKGHLLSSVIWDFEPIFTKLVTDFNAGNFGKEPYSLTFEDNSTYLLKTTHIPEDIWTEVMNIRDAIIAGEISVKNTYNAADVHAIITNTVDK